MRLDDRDYSLEDRVRRVQLPDPAAAARIVSFFSNVRIRRVPGSGPLD